MNKTENIKKNILKIIEILVKLILHNLNNAVKEVKKVNVSEMEH